MPAGMPAGMTAGLPAGMIARLPTRAMLGLSPADKTSYMLSYD
jgi:hypothetical protein